jgi:hypothetical protein
VIPVCIFVCIMREFLFSNFLCQKFYPQSILLCVYIGALAAAFEDTQTQNKRNFCLLLMHIM